MCLTKPLSQGQQKRSYTFRKALPAPFSCKGAGIYAIINCLNGKIYVGSAVRLNHRWTEHRRSLEERTHGNRYLQRAFSKDPDAFQISVIELSENPTKEHLLAREQFWIGFYRSHLPENGYNIAPKAGSCMGVKHCPEYSAAISKRMTGFKHSAQARANMAAAQVGKPKKKRDEANKTLMRMLGWGRVKTPEEIEKRLIAVRKHPNGFNRKAVLQLAEDGSVIRRFEQIEDAEKEFGKRSNIHAVCKGKRPRCFGFRWRYA